MGKPNTGKNEAKGPEAEVEAKCSAEGCKSKASRFGFCNEHYEHFKFGLIKKDGKRVPDYEKKLGHYEDFLKKQKVAVKAA